MNRWLLAGIALAGLAAQDPKKGQDPDLKYDKDRGISFSKPPKTDEWEFRDKGAFYRDSKMALAHRVDTIVLEILGNPGTVANGLSVGVYDPKKTVESEWTALASSPMFKDQKKKEMKQTKLPGGAAGNVNTWYLEVTYKLDDKPMEYRLWVFVGKESQAIYHVVLTGEDGMYKKHQKVVDYALSSIKIWKIPK
jgi:hypothetical protein